MYGRRRREPLTPAEKQKRHREKKAREEQKLKELEGAAKLLSMNLFNVTTDVVLLRLPCREVATEAEFLNEVRVLDPDEDQLTAEEKDYLSCILGRRRKAPKK